MVKADFINSLPDIYVKKHTFVKDSIVDLEIGELEISLDEKTARYLLEDMEYELIPYHQTRPALEERIQEQEEIIEQLQDQLLQVKFSLI